MTHDGVCFGDSRHRFLSVKIFQHVYRTTVCFDCAPGEVRFFGPAFGRSFAGGECADYLATARYLHRAALGGFFDSGSVAKKFGEGGGWHDEEVEK